MTFRNLINSIVLFYIVIYYGITLELMILLMIYDLLFHIYNLSQQMIGFPFDFRM